MRFVNNRFFFFFATMLAVLVVLIYDAMQSNRSITTTTKVQKSIIIGEGVTFFRADNNGTIYRGSVDRVLRDGDMQKLSGCVLKNSSDENRTLIAPTIINHKNRADFNNGFTFIDTNIVLTSATATYDKNSSTLSGDGEFTIRGNVIDANGSSFTYRVESKELDAKMVDATIKRVEL